MLNSYHRPEDCKSSIIGSIPIRASIPFSGNLENISADKELILEHLSARERISYTNNSLHVRIHFANVSDFVSVKIVIVDDGSQLSLRFKYKGHRHKQCLNCSLSELCGSDIDGFVKTFVNKVDNVKTVQCLLNCVKGNPECGGNLDTQKKNDSHIRDMLQRSGIDLDSSTKVLLQVDEWGKTLMEQWQDEYGLPHKLRQIRSIFSKKNIKILKRNNFDVSHFDHFVTFVAETTHSTPFTTDDAEVDRIINFFREAQSEHPVFYDIYMLAFGAGLRASEIYQVRYDHFTTFQGQCYLLLPYATKRTKLKGQKHVEKVGISRQLYDHFTNRELGGEVINGGLRLHRRFVKFLKEKVGIQDNKACHRLRKILGARLATTAGIFHAAKTLRNSVGVCEKYYSDLTSHANELEV